MRLLSLFLLVGFVSIFQLYAAVPIGLAGRLDRGSIIVAAWVGGMIGVVAFVYYGPTIGEWIKRGGQHVRKTARRVRGLPPEPLAPTTDEAAEAGRVRQYAERWGEPFLGIVGPMTIGGWAAAVLGTSLGMSRVKLIVWLAVGQAVVVVVYVWTLKTITG